MSRKSFNLPRSGSVYALLVAATLTLSAQTSSGTSNGNATAAGQDTTSTSAQNTQSATPAATQSNGTAQGTSATGQPLSTKSNEGFWGHVNPLARKKWVSRQVNPVKDRLNELDQLSSKNSSDIKDLDTRSQSGIHKAQDTADQATQQANTANTQAGQAQQLAQKASTQTELLNNTVTNLDQYSSVADTEIHFRPGQTVLNAKAKEALDQVAQQLQGQKGYIVEVEGYSHARGQVGITNSHRLADAVVRYLVVQHQVPVYRIHQVAMGNAPAEGAASDESTGKASASSARGSLVHVKLMHNSLAAANMSGQTGSSPIGSTQQSSTQPSPQGAASQPQQ